MWVVGCYCYIVSSHSVYVVFPCGVVHGPCLQAGPNTIALTSTLTLFGSLGQSKFGLVFAQLAPKGSKQEGLVRAKCNLQSQNHLPIQGVQIRASSSGTHSSLSTPPTRDPAAALSLRVGVPPCSPPWIRARRSRPRLCPALRARPPSVHTRPHPVAPVCARPPPVCTPPRPSAPVRAGAPPSAFRACAPPSAPGIHERKEAIQLQSTPNHAEKLV
jgi:hypothetical protein